MGKNNKIVNSTLGNSNRRLTEAEKKAEKNNKGGFSLGSGAVIKDNVVINPGKKK